MKFVSLFIGFAVGCLILAGAYTVAFVWSQPAKCPQPRTTSCCVEAL